MSPFNILSAESSTSSSTSVAPDQETEVTSGSALAATVDAAPTVGNSAALAHVTEAFAAEVYAKVTTSYLEFRRQIYHEELPSVATDPPQHAQVPRGGLALLAFNTSRLMPASVRTAPILGGLLEHLEEVADLHSLSDAKCLALSKLSLTLLAGVRGGLQSWYVEWALATARNLSHVDQSDYFFTFPWDACLYKSPDDLVKFETAVRDGDCGEIERQVAQIGDRLITALRDPMAVQSRYAFIGEESEWRKVIFDLKTSAALMLGAYLVSEEARALLRPRQVKPAPVLAEAPLPEEASWR
ncbi:MAG: hypothetical protein ACLQUY_22910 [Ktedonobacterales bacterium]